MSVQSTATKTKRTTTTVTHENYPVISSNGISTTPAGTQTLDCSLRSIWYKTGGTGTFTLSNIAIGQTVNIVVTSTGSAYTITWASSGLTFRWNSASVPTPTITASRFDLYSFIRIGTNIFGTVSLNMG